MRSSSVVRLARADAGMTQAALAVRAATAQSAIAAYEHGSKEPSPETMTRVARAAGYAVCWTLLPIDLVTVSTVQTVAEAVEDGRDKEALRVVADLAVALDALERGALIEQTRADPGSTGDRRWDALIGGIVERAAHRAEVRTPSWTAAPGRFLDRWWFVSPYRSLHASALVHSPPELASRGVFLHEQSLARV